MISSQYLPEQNSGSVGVEGSGHDILHYPQLQVGVPLQTPCSWCRQPWGAGESRHTDHQMFGLNIYLHLFETGQVKPTMPGILPCSPSCPCLTLTSISIDKEEICRFFASLTESSRYGDSGMSYVALIPTAFTRPQRVAVYIAPHPKLYFQKLQPRLETAAESVYTTCYYGCSNSESRISCMLRKCSWRHGS